MVTDATHGNAGGALGSEGNEPLRTGAQGEGTPGGERLSHSDSREGDSAAQTRQPRFDEQPDDAPLEEPVDPAELDPSDEPGDDPSRTSGSEVEGDNPRSEG